MRRGGQLGRLATGATLLLAALWLYPLRPLLGEVGRQLSPRALAGLFGDDPEARMTLLWYGNSIGTAVAITLLTLLLSIPCAYAASRLDFPGKRALYWALLAGIIVPKEVLIVPHFQLVDAVRWFDSYPGIVAPQIVFPLVIVVLQRFYDRIPDEYREAAKLDGAREFRILTAIYLPLSGWVTLALAALVFLTAWNNFLWPFLVAFNDETFTLPVAIGRGSPQGVALMLVTVALLVLLVWGALALAARASRSGLRAVPKARK